MTKTNVSDQSEELLLELVQFELESSARDVMRGCEAVRHHCMTNGVAESIIQDVTLIFEEAASNVVNHAYRDGAGTIHVAVRVTAIAVEIELRDQGPIFDPTAPPDLELVQREFDECQVGGFGIHLVRRLADTIEYSRDGGENRLRIIRRFGKEER